MGRRTLLRAAGVAGMAALGTLGSGAADAATAPEVEWSRVFGGGRSDLAFSVTATNDGGFAFCGENASVNNGHENGWLVKTDAEGRKQWSETFDRSGINRGFSVVQDPDGSYTLAGFTRENSFSLSDGWLVKADADGTEQWRRRYTAGHTNVVRSHVRTRDGGYLLAGYSEDEGLADAWLVKTDGEGREQWNRTYAPGDELTLEAAGDVTRTADGGYVFAGRYRPSQNFMWLVKVDADGDRQWARRYGGSDYELAKTVVQTADGGFAFAGEVNDFTRPDARVIKTGPDGREEWRRTVGGRGRRSFQSLVQLPDGGFVVAGHLRTSDTDEFDGWLLRLDAAGDRQWSRFFGGDDDDLPFSLARAADGGYVVAGPTKSFGRSAFDGWLAKVASANEPPVARFDYLPTPPVAGEPTTFDASASSDPDGAIATYEWDFDDDGTTDGTGRTVTHTYESGGERTVTLEVTDGDGATDVASETFLVHLEVDIDVRPGSETNPVNPASSGPVRVAVLPGDGFDPVSEVATDTLRFGHVEDVESGGGATPTRTKVRRVRGEEALVVAFPLADTGFGDATRGPLPGVGVTDNTAVAELVGETTDGTPLFGLDDVRLVGGDSSGASGRGGGNGHGRGSGRGGGRGRGNGRGGGRGGGRGNGRGGGDGRGSGRGNGRGSGPIRGR